MSSLNAKLFLKSFKVPPELRRDQKLQRSIDRAVDRNARARAKNEENTRVQRAKREQEKKDEWMKAEDEKEEAKRKGVQRKRLRELSPEALARKEAEEKEREEKVQESADKLRELYVAQEEAYGRTPEPPLTEERAKERRWQKHKAEEEAAKKAQEDRQQEAERKQKKEWAEWWVDKWNRKRAQVGLPPMSRGKARQKLAEKTKKELGIRPKKQTKQVKKVAMLRASTAWRVKNQGGFDTRTKKTKSTQVRESALFRPMRSIGVVTDGTPMAFERVDEKNTLVCSTGRSFSVIVADEQFNVVQTGPRLNERINAILMVGSVIFVALQKDIVAFHRLAELARFVGHESTPTVMCAVGHQFLISASETEALVFRIMDMDMGNNRRGEDDGSGSVKSCHAHGRLVYMGYWGYITALCQPPTYLHKVLAGSSTGHVAIWNVRKDQFIYKIKAHRAEGRELSAVTCICEAQAVLDTAAVGFASGRICVLNIREDTLLMEFNQAQGRVMSMCFRAGPDAPAHLVSGAPNGTFVLWDLNKKRALCVKEGAHRNAVTTALFLFNQPVLITGGKDNAIRMWMFNTPDGLPRLFKEKRGCPGPPRRMMFYGEDQDRSLLVAGASEGHGFVAKVKFTKQMLCEEFSVANIKKLPGRYRSVTPMVDMDYCFERHFDWPCIVTAHENCDAALLWNALHRALAPMCLEIPMDEGCVGIPVTAVAVSKCGNYCVVGLENGTIHRFNLQSQLHRGPFPMRPEAIEAKAKKIERPDMFAHTGRISGLTITASGKVVSIAANPRDCNLKLWGLFDHKEIASIPLDGNTSGSPCNVLLRARAALVAVSQDDGRLQVVDLHGLNVVRTFFCGIPATDAAFSSDGRWLAAALRDGGLRVFDLPAARCVDSFSFSRPALSVCFSPSNAYLLTSHAKGNAIQTWANKFLFDPNCMAPLLSEVPTRPIRVDDPMGDSEDEDVEKPKGGKQSSLKNKHKLLAKARRKHVPVNAGHHKKRYEAANPLAPELFTLSDIPPQKWLATLHLDLIKERNKVQEAPKDLPAAPFFLPTAHDGVIPRFAQPLGEDGGEDPAAESAAANTSRIVFNERRPLEGTQFQVNLRKKDFDGALRFLKKQTPSGVHLALEELGSLAGGDVGELKTVLEFFAYHIAKGHYADEVQAYLSLFLQAHGEEISEAPELRELCTKLGEAQELLWSKLSAQCQKARCFLGILTQTQSQW